MHHVEAFTTSEALNMPYALVANVSANDPHMLTSEEASPIPILPAMVVAVQNLVVPTMAAFTVGAFFISLPLPNTTLSQNSSIHSSRASLSLAPLFSFSSASTARMPW